MGPADEYVELYREYLPRILNYMRLRVDGEDLAQDLTAEVFERAIARQATLRKREAFGAWLFRIARNTVAAHYRTRKKTLGLDEVEEQAAPTSNPVQTVIQREQVDRMRQALSTLSEREQEIIRLKFGGGLGNQEIARLLRLRPGHVAVLLYRALRKLRSLLQDEPDFRQGADGV